MPKAVMPKYSALQELLMEKKGIKLSIIDGQWAISEEVHLGLPKRTRAIKIYVLSDPGGQPGRGGGRNYTLQVVLRLSDADYKMVREDIKTVVLRTSGIDPEKAYSYQDDGAIDLCVKKIVALYPEFEPFRVYGFWAVHDFIKMVLRVKSGQANTRAREALKPVDDTVKPRKKRGRPRKSAIARELLAAAQPPIENLPVPLVSAQPALKAPEGQPSAQGVPEPVPSQLNVVPAQPVLALIQPVLVPAQPVAFVARPIAAPAQRAPDVANGAADDGYEEFDFGDLDDDTSMLTALEPSAMNLDIERSIIEPLAHAKLTDEDDDEDDGHFDLARELGEPLTLVPSHTSTPAPARRTTPVAATRIIAADIARASAGPGQATASGSASTTVVDCASAPAAAALVSIPVVPVPAVAASTPAAATIPVAAASASAALATSRATPDSTKLGLRSSVPNPALTTVSQGVVISHPVRKAIAPFASTTLTADPAMSIVWHGLTLKPSDVEKYRALGANQAQGNRVRCGPMYRDLVDRFATDPTYDPSSEPLAPDFSDPLVPAASRGGGRGGGRGSSRARGRGRGCGGARVPAPEDCMVSDVDADVEVDMTRVTLPDPSPKKPEQVARAKPKMRPVPAPDADTESVAGNRLSAPPGYIAASATAAAPDGAANEQGAASVPYTTVDKPPVAECADNPVSKDTEKDVDEGIRSATGSALETTRGATSATGARKAQGKAAHNATSKASTSTGGAKRGIRARASTKAPAQPVRRSTRGQNI